MANVYWVVLDDFLRIKKGQSQILTIRSTCIQNSVFDFLCVARSANIFYKGVADLIAISGVESRVELLISETNGFRF